MQTHINTYTRGIGIDITQTFNWYESAQGAGTQRGGAYIFRPNHTYTHMHTCTHIYLHTYTHTHINTYTQGISIDITQTFNWYESAQGAGTQRGGAYIFRPNHTDASGGGAKCVNKDCNAVLTVVRNALCTEVRQVFAT